MLDRDSTEAAIFKQSSAVGISSLSVWKSLHFSVKIPLEPVNRFSTMSTLLCSSWNKDQCINKQDKQMHFILFIYLFIISSYTGYTKKKK